MCGRYTLIQKLERHAAEVLGLVGGGSVRLPYDPDDMKPRYNIAPTQHAPVVRACEGGLRLDELRWGLVPGWMHDLKRSPLINARAETVAEKPAFKHALKARRCLVPADGFYEWTAAKQPHWFRLPEGRLFAFAGLWEGPNELAPDGSFTLITTTPNDVVAAVHDRMPVILPREAYRRWLDPEQTDLAELVAMLRPWAGAMSSRPVSKRLNSGREEGDPSLESSAAVKSSSGP